MTTHVDRSVGGRRPGGRQVIPRPTATRPGGRAAWADEIGRVDLSVDAVLRRLSRHDAARPIAPAFPDARPSAVLIALVDGADGAEVLLTKRSQHLRNHRGEISFPGGRIDAGETPHEAAVREAFEEVRLDPDSVQVVAQLEPISTVVSKSYILPIVARLDERPPLVPHDAEVDRILWASLGELARADTYRGEWWGTPPLDREMHFFDLDDETIWGATGRMLHELVARAHGLAVATQDWW
jgi:8-oxo-dGTP pyrophosphatase MutT (NUDIX family)